MRMLLVDDDPRMLAALGALVAMVFPEVQVETAASASEAMARIERSSFDCVISDVVMETPDAGWRVARRARALGLRVLLLSGDDRAPWLALERDVPLLRKDELTMSTVSSLITGFLLSDTG